MLQLEANFIKWLFFFFFFFLYEGTEFFNGIKSFIDHQNDFQKLQFLTLYTHFLKTVTIWEQSNFQF